VPPVRIGFKLYPQISQIIQKINWYPQISQITQISKN